MKQGIVKSGSANIYYEIHGHSGQNNDVLVLLHGNGESSVRFKDLVPKFADNYKVLAIDSRGHGKSEFGKAELSLGAMVIDLETVLMELGFNRVNIIGFSDGANIAMEFAIKNPDIVNKLVLVGGNYNFRGLTLSTRAMIFAGYWCSVLSSLFDTRNRLNKEYLGLMYKEPKLKRSALRYIKAETLVINSTKDMIRYSHAKAMADTIPKAMLKRVDGDHFWIYRKPAEAYKVIYKFLKD